MRVLGIDYGKKRVGLALSDPFGFFAYPFETIENDSNLIKNLAKIVIEKEISVIVLGYPFKYDGSRHELCDEIDKFSDVLKKEFSLNVVLIDESYSSKIASDRILESVTKKSKRRDKKLIDMNAAAILIEDYLRMGKNLS